MKKRIASLVLALCLLAGCASADADMPASASPSDAAVSSSAPAASTAVTFVDDLGREVTVDRPQRTAALLGSYADLWFLAGGQICASADDAWDDFNLPLAEDAVNLGKTKKLSMESLLASDPDFVLASTNSSQHLEWQSTLESTGIPVAYFDVKDFSDYLRVLKICTDITGNQEAYTKYGTDVQAQIQEILARRAEEEPQTVLVLRASASFIRAKNSDGTVLGNVLKDFGCINIADSDESLLENLNVESIALANPDKIFLIQSGDDAEGTRANVEQMFRDNPLWQQLDAVKNEDVYFMDKALFNLKPNARWAESYEQAEAVLYGE